MGRWTTIALMLSFPFLCGVGCDEEARAQSEPTTAGQKNAEPTPGAASKPTPTISAGKSKAPKANCEAVPRPCGEGKVEIEKCPKGWDCAVHSMCGQSRICIDEDAYRTKAWKADPVPSVRERPESPEEEPSIELRRMEVLASTKPARAAEQIQQWIDHARPEQEVMIEMRTTLDYGCPCPTWTFAPFHNGPNHGFPYAMVLPDDDVQDPTEFALNTGIYRMTGRFTGEKMTGLEWAKARGSEPPNFPDAKPPLETWKNDSGPVFIVESWCFQPTDETQNDEPDSTERLREQGAEICN